MRRDWPFYLDVDRHAPLPAFLQVARAIAAEIQRGRLKPGDRLPGSRRLADDVGLHRNTILAALAELSSEGWIESAAGRGTYVTATLPENRRRSRPVAERASAIRHAGFALSEVPAAYRPPLLPRGTLNLSNGAPDLRLVPARAIGRAYRRALGSRSADLLAYGDPEGHVVLREAVASMLASTRALPVNADEICITRGSQMALTLAARALVRPGDTVAVEATGYRPAWEAFRAAGATVVPVAVDQHGLNVDALTRLARRTPLRAVYVTPHHQYPTTVTLKAARRIALLALARTERMAIVEDDYDHEFHYDGRPVLPLASADHAGTVVYIGTLSKVLAPALRIGYIAAPRDLLQRIGAIRSLLDIQGDRPTEAAVAALIADGELQRHIARARRIYAARRHILAAALRRLFGTEVTFTVPSGGMALWVQFAAAIDMDAWSRRCVDHGVFWYSGRRYAFDGSQTACVRFSFAWLNERELPEAVKRMAAARG